MCRPVRKSHIMQNKKLKEQQIAFLGDWCCCCLVSLQDPHAHRDRCSSDQSDAPPPRVFIRRSLTKVCLECRRGQRKKGLTFLQESSSSFRFIKHIIGLLPSLSTQGKSTHTAAFQQQKIRTFPVFCFLTR